MTATASIPVHPGNLDQLRAWNGEQGAFWAAHPQLFERSIAGFDAALLDAAGVGRTDRVLDLGCGTGGITRAAARLATAGSILGVDLSSPMLAVAARKAKDDGLSNIEFLQADAQIHPFEPASFDAAVSRMAPMFFADRVAALANIGRALRPGGRLALLVWQPPRRNEWLVEMSATLAAGRQLPPPPGTQHPFSLADPAVTRQILVDAGYIDVRIDGRDGVMDLGPDPELAYQLGLDQFARITQDLDDDARRRGREAWRRSIASHTGPDGVRYGNAVWLIAARLPDRAPARASR